MVYNHNNNITLLQLRWTLLLLLLLLLFIIVSTFADTTTTKVLQLNADGSVVSASEQVDNDGNGRILFHDNIVPHSYQQQQEDEQDGNSLNNFITEIKEDGEHEDYGEDMGVIQDYDVNHRKEIYHRIQQARMYLQRQQTLLQQQQQHSSSNNNNKEQDIMQHQRLELIRDKCRNRHESCAYWAVMDQCQEHADYMNETCAPVCFACDSLFLEHRCPLDPNAINVWQPGDLNQIFERIITDPDLAKYQPHVWSRPLPKVTTNTTPFQIGPWLVTLDNFLSPEEADTFVELGYQMGFQRCIRAGNIQWNGVQEQVINDTRTCDSAFCDMPMCVHNATVQTLMQRLEHVTLIPEANFQHMNILRYEPGQFFAIHHDFMAHHQYRQQGVRQLTVIMYFNSVEEGGGTNFPKLNNLTIVPQKGRAVIWPLVQDDNPNLIDDRMDHQSLPVIRGIKYAANNYAHQRDFKTPHSNRCT